MASNTTKNRIMWAVLLVCTVGIVGIVYLTGVTSDTPVPAQQVLPLAGNQPVGSGFTPTPQPPGAAPPGKVWNEPHGHWHDADNPNLQTTIQPAGGSPTNPTLTPSPQPPGEAPLGKVWNEPHGHWHDAPTQSGTTTPTSILPGIPPPTPPNSFTPTPQPAGNPPPGKVWNEPHGHWHDDPSLTPANQSPTIRQIEVTPLDNP